MPTEPTVSKDKLLPCLVALGWPDPSEKMMAKALGIKGKLKQRFTWEEFIKFTQDYRELEKEQFHKRAGFSEEEVARYREQFDEYDRDHSGDISLKELYPLLEAIGKGPRNVRERDKLAKMIADVDEDGGGEIDFLEFLRLMRRFLDDADIEKMQKEKDAIANSKFEEHEISMWRQIFEQYDPDGSGELDKDEVKLLLRTVGIRVDLAPPIQQAQYSQLFQQCDQDESDSLDLPEFLILMRRFIDVDFGGLAAKLKPPDDKDKKK